MTELVKIQDDHKRPFAGIAGSFGVQQDESVQGTCLPVGSPGFYVSLREGGWRYWRNRRGQPVSDESFTRAVGRLVPLTSKDFFARLNKNASGPVSCSGGLFAKNPDGRPFIYDLEDRGLVERFARSCVVGEAIRLSEKVLSLRRNASGDLLTEAAEPVQGALPVLNLNLALWAFEAPSQSLILFPNALILRREKWQWVVPYGEAGIRFQTKRHPFTDDTPGDVERDEASGDAVFGELTLAISDQRVVLQFSNPAHGRRAGEALRMLIEEARARQPSRRVRRERSAEPVRKKTSSLGIVVRQKLDISVKPNITIKAKERSASAAGPARVMVKVRAATDGEAPRPEESQGVPTPAPSDCDLGLTFYDEAPDLGPPGDDDSARLALAEGSSRLSLRESLGCLLAYVAKSDQTFTEPEQAVIRDVLCLPSAFHLDEEFGELGELEDSCARLQDLPQEEREQVYADCERVAWADQNLTRNEHARLNEIKKALGLA